MKWKTLGIIGAIFLISLSFRINGLFDNHPFWVDEFSTANQAELLQKHGLSLIGNQDVFFEFNKLTTTGLALAGLRFFGHEESSARFFFTLAGALIPVVILLIARYTGIVSAALPAALLSATSYLLITWSRQARSYSLSMLFILTSTLLYFHIIDRKHPRYALALYSIVAFFGIFTHPFFYLIIIAHFIHFLFEMFLRKEIHAKHHKSTSVWFFVIICVTLVFAGTIISAIKGGIVHTSNNLWLYHAYLWREYSLISVLGVIGLMMGVAMKQKYFLPILIHTLLHLVFITFFFATATTRYVLPIFPWLLLGVGYSLAVGSDAFVKTYFAKNTYAMKYRRLIPIIVVLGIIVNGYKFDMKPNRFYSVNHDFREIALIDYDEIYDIIQEKGQLEKEQTAVIDTWVDRSMWYLGLNYPALYNFRWADEGVMKRTPFQLNEKGEKVLYKRSQVRFITELSDLQTAMKTYKRGFLIIDDSSMPADVISFADKNFKKELFLDRYPLDDNPLSNWPITLYSWGTSEIPQ